MAATYALSDGLHSVINRLRKDHDINVGDLITKGAESAIKEGATKRLRHRYRKSPLWKHLNKMKRM